jgi:hypothetical protein
MKNERCENLACIKRYWPGRDPDLVCIAHAQESKRIADAMGFHLHLELIVFTAVADASTDFPVCCCSIEK